MKKLQDFDPTTNLPPQNTETVPKKRGRPKNADETRMDQIGEVSIFDESQPRTLINIVTPDVQIAIKRLSQRRRHIFFLDEREFKKRVDPDAVTSRLRLSFWDEYTRAQDKGETMKVKNICNGCCSVDYFYKAVLTNSNKLAWIICPPKDYMLAMRELLDVGIDEWRDILTMKHVNKKGQINVALIAQKIKIVQMLDLRVKGAIIQKLQVSQKNLNVNVDGPALHEDMSMEDLQALESQLNRITEAAAPLRLTPSEPYNVTEAEGRRVNEAADGAETYEAEISAPEPIDPEED